MLAPERSTLQIRTSNDPAHEESLPVLEGAHRGPLDFFAAVVRGEVKPDGLSSLETNLIVTEILDAARTSAQTGRRVDLAKEP
jgi:predicted dehydrogenase